jgi:hypothetical protein
MPNGAAIRAITTKSLSSGCGETLFANRLFADHWGRFLVALDEFLNGVGRLCAFAFPVGQTIHRNAQRFVIAGRDRVVKTQTLDKTAIARIARISNNDIEKGATAGTAACESDNDHELFLEGK